MKHIVSFSGGKDSTAMLLMMLEKNITIDRIIFADTTLELPEIYDYIRNIDKYIGENYVSNGQTTARIEYLLPSKSWDDWFYGEFTRGKLKGQRRGFPYVIQKCWWNREAKYQQLDKAHKNIGKNNIIYIGIAKDEEHRTKSKQYRKKDMVYKFPLVEWGITEKECYEYLNKKGLPHPMYGRRSGCWLCPKQSIESLRYLFINHPGLWGKLKIYEKDSPHGFRNKYNLSDMEYRFRLEDLRKPLRINGDEEGKF